MKKLLIFLCLLGLVNANDKIISIGVTPYPTAMILENVKDLVAEQGYELKIVEFNDYILPNYAVNDEELDANFTQTKPFLDSFNEERGSDLVSAGKIFIGPMAAYSKTIKNIKDLPKNALVYIPSDPINGTRALELLAKSNLIEFSENSKTKTILDISKNPLNLNIKEIEAPQLTRTLNECDLAVINTNYALLAKLNPIKDSILHEDSTSDYASVLAVKSKNINSQKTKVLLKAMQSEKMREFLNKNFKDILIPSF